MSNDYYNNTANTLTAGETAKAAIVEAKFTEVAGGFDVLPTEEEIKRETINFVDSTGTANTYAVTLTYEPDTYVDGMRVTFRVNVTNTGASTLNVNSLGAKSLKQVDGSDPGAGALTATRIVKVIYDSDTDTFILRDAIETINVSSGILTWEVITGATNAVAGHGYLCNTSGGALTLTLPASPSVGDTIGIKDAASTFNTYNVTVARNSLKIMGLSEDMTVDLANISLELVYSGATYGWRI